MPRSEASKRLLLAALGLSPDELNDALVWARHRAAELLDSLDDAELRALLDRERIASPRRSRIPTPATSPPKRPAARAVPSWNVPRAPWQPSRPAEPVASEGELEAEPAGFVQEDEIASEGELEAEPAGFVEEDEVASEGELEAEPAGFVQEDEVESEGGLEAEPAGFESELEVEPLGSSMDDEVAYESEPPVETLGSPPDDETAYESEPPTEPHRSAVVGEIVLESEPPPLPEPPAARPRASPRAAPTVEVPVSASARRVEPEPQRDPDAPVVRTDRTRRRAQRYSLSTPVVVRVDRMPGLLELNTRDISRHGIFIESTSPPEPNSRIAVQLPFPDGSGVVDLVGQVVRVVTTREAAASGRAPGFGVTFSPVSDENRRELERLLEHAKSSAAADVPRRRRSEATQMETVQYRGAAAKLSKG
ncbi:PilZ domain-containing protein [Paraliomyxa miuraensis]|uniref:PilZ domain-containing protein n=1 Tax=Paraliomyxa miuraensis TaxID=376150 RepID=UPI00225A395D|nr:PilZ domain-containing protein [Paraliomyxa miuraensis]MCX4247806.1 PilZ domain-containing protein [Paraliomyxa miuraensis]